MIRTKTHSNPNPPKWPSTSLFGDFFYLTDWLQGFKTKYQNPRSLDFREIYTHSIVITFLNGLLTN